MAFDRPIEADRVEDLGLFASFLRAPVVGTILWLLGGEEAKKAEDEAHAKFLGQIERLEQIATATDNAGAQSLYEAQGWTRDTGFFTYGKSLR